MKKVPTIILLVVCSLIANILLDTVVIVAWSFNSAGGVLLSILLGIAAAAAVCALGVTVCEKIRVRRRTLLICAQAPALAIAAILYIDVLIDYIHIMNRVSAGEMFDGLERGLTVAFYQMFTVILITVLLTTAALAMTLLVTYIKRKRGSNE